MEENTPKGLTEALIQFQSSIESIPKDGTNPHFRSRYATLDGIWETIRKPLAETGLAVVQFGQIDYPLKGQGNPDGQPVLVTQLRHTSGEEISSILPITAAKPNDPQAFGSAWTYMRRYGLMGILGLTAGDDDDGEKASGGGSQEKKPAPPAQAAPPFKGSDEGPPYEGKKKIHDDICTIAAKSDFLSKEEKGGVIDWISQPRTLEEYQKFRQNLTARIQRNREAAEARKAAVS